MNDVEAHECFLTERLVAGQPVLTPCKVCGATAASIMERLRNDSLRQVVMGFIDEAERLTQGGYTAQATARRALWDRLENAGLNPAFAPRLESEARSPRHAAAVRELHRLEALPGTSLLACAADGYISGDMTQDPCPTLAALNESDPAPERVIDQQKLARAIETAVLGLLANGGLHATGESRGYWISNAVEQITDDHPAIDLADPATVNLIVDAITHPAALASRDGDAIPGWQARAVIKALAKAAKR